MNFCKTKCLAIIVQKCTELYGTFSNQWNLRKYWYYLNIVSTVPYGNVNLVPVQYSTAPYIKNTQIILFLNNYLVFIFMLFYHCRVPKECGHDKTKWHLIISGIGFSLQTTSMIYNVVTDFMINIPKKKKHNIHR